METKYKYQGAGRDFQKELLGKWFKELGEANEKKEPVAYVFISGNIAELLRVFDFHLVYPEVNALQCAIKRTAGEYILAAEEASYSPDVCAYVKNDIGLVMKGNHAPFGDLPVPDLLLCNYSGCNTYIKWFEALADIYGTEIFMFDVPYVRSDDGEITPADMKYVLKQFQDLIKVCERITGKKYDEEKLKMIMELSKLAEDAWVKILHSAKQIPSPFDSFFEAVFFMAPIYVLRGTQDCVDYYELAYKEIEERAQHGLGPIAEEKFRIVMEGPPPWPHFRKFWEMFKKWDVCVVASTYSKVGGIWDFGFRHDASRPLESLAEYSFTCYTNWNWDKRIDMIERYINEYKADGLVINSVKSCRAFSVGQGDCREYFSEKGVPTLFVESDLCDPRYFSEAQMKNRIDAFFEAMTHKRAIGQA